jgi:hypothetical protein
MKSVVLFLQIICFFAFQASAANSDSVMANPITVVGKISKEAFVSADGSALVFGVKSGQGEKKYACKITAFTPMNASWEYLACILARDEEIIIHGNPDRYKEFIVIDDMTIGGKKYPLMFELATQK